MNATKTKPTKSVDLPPYGPSNPDPLTDSPGSHPIETGVGAALIGVARVSVDMIAMFWAASRLGYR